MARASTSDSPPGKASRPVRHAPPSPRVLKSIPRRPAQRQCLKAWKGDRSEFYRTPTTFPTIHPTTTHLGRRTTALRALITPHLSPPPTKSAPAITLVAVGYREPLRAAPAALAVNVTIVAAAVLVATAVTVAAN